MRRLPESPGQVIDRTRAINFEADGRTVIACAGDTIASALSAAGQTVFSRSFKYHRPRGLLCVSGKCPNCLMNVDGVPNVRTCTQPVREGMRVRSQNCWPSLKWDWMSFTQWIDFLLPVGFYYKIFARPSWAWKRAEPIIRRMAGLGRISADAPDEHFEHVHLHCQIAVVGGGPAGLGAALTAAEAGADVVLVDDQEELGGHVRYYDRLPAPLSVEPDLRGFELARRLTGPTLAHSNIRILKQALAFGAYEGGLLAIRHQNSLIHLRAEKLVVAGGSFEYPPTFEGNDLPGIMLASGVRRLIQLYGVAPGREAVICGCDDDALALALDLQEKGIKVRAVGDTRECSGGSWIEALSNSSIPVLQSHRVVRASGSRRAIEQADLAKFDSEGRELPGSRRSIACDLLVLCTQYAPSVELLRQSGVKCEYDETFHQMVPVQPVADVFSAGRLSGFRHLDIEVLQGRLAGLTAAAEVLNKGQALESSIAGLRSELLSREQEFKSTVSTRTPVLLSETSGQFVCLCEDVQQKDITRAIREGFNELETLKRYSTTSMGPCQGRMCLMSASTLCAAQTGRTLRETGATTARPPVQPIALGLLAGAHHHPLKLTPMHYKHLAAGATQMDMGEWKRPHTYTSQRQEWQAVRERVGIIDLSTLGKLDVKGKDAGRLLDKVYTHVFSKLAVGRVRYGVICNDEGIILDDGTISRLSEEHYFITTTTGNVDFVEAWMKWWTAGTDLCAHVTNVTGEYAAVNVAGPQARDTLRKLTELDLSTEKFKYMMCRDAEVAGVPARLLRIGFVGETGWEIHYPACFGEYLWDAILDAGFEFGIEPFGVETQRILRLEKKHLIVGQDTDALSNPFEADMAWCVKLEKNDFVGKSGLTFLHMRAQQQKLVGFICDSNQAIPEGSVVVQEDKPVGRVTSCRLSPCLGRCIGMAWVPFDSSADGQTIQISSNGTRVPAQVVSQPFYDPEGIRLKG